MPSKNLFEWKLALLAVKKYKGITSAKAVDEIKNIICDETGTHEWLKFGHGGTLDESATGVLVIGTGLGCKLLTKFLHGVKSYEVCALMGEETDTLNSCGHIINRMPFDHVKSESMKFVCQQYVGNIMQLPPKYSALKFGGVRSSDLTRAGVDVPIVPRKVKCHSVDLLEFTPPLFVLRVKCGGGFYIRSLIRDLAQSLGTCAHVTELNRIQHGFLTENDALPKEHWTYATLLQQARQIRRKPEFKSVFTKFTHTM